jgi:hypothetical protein
MRIALSALVQVFDSAVVISLNCPASKGRDN